MYPILSCWTSSFLIAIFIDCVVGPFTVSTLPLVTFCKCHVNSASPPSSALRPPTLGKGSMGHSGSVYYNHSLTSSIHGDRALNWKWIPCLVTWTEESVPFANRRCSWVLSWFTSIILCFSHLLNNYSNALMWKNAIFKGFFETLYW